MAVSNHDPVPGERVEADVHDVEVHVPDATAASDDASEAVLAARAEADLTTGDPATQNGAMRDLASAFQANAEALRGLHEIHADLSTAIKRGDRSELVLQSTQALNETFRNLTLVQRQLLMQMEDVGRRTNRTPLVPLMILGLLVVLLGGVYLLVDLIQQSQPTVREFANLKAASERGRLEAFQEGEARGSQTSAVHVARIESELEKSDVRLQIAEEDRDAAQGAIEQLERTKRSLEIERDELAERALKSQNEAMARELVEDELRRMRADLELAKRRAAQADADYQQERLESENLRKRLAAFGFGLPDDDEMFRVTRGRDDSTRAPVAASPDDSGDVSGDSQPVAFPPPESAEVPTADRGVDLNPWQPIDRSGTRPPPPPPPPVDSSDLPDPTLRRQVNLERDTAIGDQIRQKMNRLLDLSRRRLPESWQITKVGGFTRELLGEVILLQYDADDRKVGHIEASELHIEYSAERRAVEFLLEDGKRVRGRTETPLPPEGLRLVVGQGPEMVRLWRDSGLVMVKKR